MQQAALADSRARTSQQQAALAASEQELGILRARLQDIAVLRVSVLQKLRQSLEAQLGPRADAAAEPVTLTDNGNLVLSEKLLFEYGSYAIRDDAKPLLDSLARALAGVLDDVSVRANIDTILIQGHTDERGSASLNWDLSARRATAVLDYLFAANPALAQSYGSYFAASAYSKFRPIDPAHTEEAYQQNRRIEIAVIPRDDNVRKVIDEYTRTIAPPP